MKLAALALAVAGAVVAALVVTRLREPIPANIELFWSTRSELRNGGHRV